MKSNHGGLAVSIYMLFLLFAGTPVLAEEIPEEIAEATEWDFSVDTRLETITWPQQLGAPTNNSLTRLQLIPTLTAKPSEAWRFFTKAELFLDPQNHSLEERWFADLSEAFVRRKWQTASLQAGNMIVNWGVTDGYNPLDVVNPRQYFDPLRSKKLGSPGLLWSNSTATTEQEIFYIPENRSPLLPGTESRWLPREVYVPWTGGGSQETLIIANNLRYRYGYKEVLNEALKNNIAARFQYHSTGEKVSFDISLIGFEGVAGFPIVQLREFSGTLLEVSPRQVIRAEEVVLGIKHYRQRVVGYSWVSSQADFLLKYASSYSVSLGDDRSLPGWEHRNIIAAEKNFTLTENIGLTGVLQYSFVNSEISTNSNFSVNEIFRRSWMAGFRGTVGELWTITALGLYDTAHFSHFEDISVARRVFDVWNVQAGAIFISGAAATPLGVYDKNDSYTLSLSRSF